ncbi:hypothetical protein FOS14_19405 [Skermania sp. ID1734]|uniref:hypothetical protein n=1 Tax=Skermania sp. ID1734 TaxID=2597516 RepID=UPI001180CEB8|nr:hypothetical protein [Skermania sp. ID1734]TSD94811.1 hypothetical protein FOS14_19405 [Skermania sp. ID1734]
MPDRSQGSAHPGDRARKQVPTRVDDPLAARPSHDGASTGNPRSDGTTRAAAAEQWATLAPLIAGRKSVRKCTAETGKFDTWGRLTPTLPTVPSAVHPYDANAWTTIIVCDFDPSRKNSADPLAQQAAEAAVAAEARQLVEWVGECGGTAVVDVSTRGGRHVYIPLSSPLRKEHIEPLLRLLATRLRTLDIQPMLGPRHGCITAPGSPCRGGGYRQLVDLTVVEARDRLARRTAPPDLVARLCDRLRHQLAFDDPAHTVDPDIGRRPTPATTDPNATVAHPIRAPLPTWIAPFLAHGTVPAHRTRADRTWTPSEARLAVLEHHASRGWSLVDVRATQPDPLWAAFWSGYERRDAGRRLALDWDRALSYAEHRTAATARKSATPVQEREYLHTGGIGGARWKLAAARKWILVCGEFAGPQRWSALLVVTALAYGLSLDEDRRTVAAGGRWLSLAAGLLSEDTVWSVLRRLRSIPGSPIELVESWSGPLHTGDRYRFVTPILDGREVEPSEWESYAARIDPVDGVWKQIGWQAWWVHEALRWLVIPGETITRSDLALAARVSVATVDRAVAILAEHGLVDVGHGWVSITGRPPRAVPFLADIADDEREAKLARHRRERATFYEFWDIVSESFTAREIRGYTSIGEVDHYTPAYMAATGWRGPPEIDERDEDADADAIVLLTAVFGELVVIEERTTARA